MQNMLEKDDILKPPKVGEIVQGKIINKGNASIFLDLGPWGTGLIYGKEFYEAKDELKDLKIGETIFVKIVDLENEEGYIELSLTRAGKELAYEELKQKKEKEESITVKIVGANKGGLLARVSGMPAFLPVSQLSSEHYPKVENGDAQEILKALQKFVGKEMEVKIFDFNQREEKLILSEKAKQTKKVKEMLKNCKVGDIVETEVTGIVDFGVFVKLLLPQVPEALEGLIHISELDWQLIEDPSKVVRPGQKVKAKIIDISNNRISLSLRALKKDPWENIEEKYRKGDIIEGKVTKFNPFGAFIKISPKIQGLCHISEFGSVKKMEETLKINEKHKFKITLIDSKKHRMTLKLLTPLEVNRSKKKHETNKPLTGLTNCLF
ncbi:MAG: 30S ribosomal protein S1 [Candidatus Nealsonbacteria bacterium CG10_big_fil_rev_8_21_14_0_10_36_24]|uniref:30S ribosomal protein S1 n=2 Tax=Candidatus Nealsoniibacteriota TaxID=1817911 RepID=A0A2H0YNI5_9BACT|nr:MAG: 30S ribosomal protein S1 [Candidatus Nealsonbacteria bacterium CG10_big_fil_rev_8_21_14_0_10_36_24]PIS40055.1 MAG: 30S ribosomal protein S1 [Candidatus Nealsonbacteria bacterium CG08_land_8_20_14_0_20_36_22]